ncbi:MAG: zinc-dependent metalloprotease [Armatimonadetes bacterium]|nr:zinc-dependent metalloprotease [Armatimonadota bacterium]MDE2206139.1 zinc-dependent metalloprotease [Armatimonadota bacterium]
MFLLKPLAALSAATLLAVAAGAAPAKTAILIYKAKAGAMARYSSTGTLTMRDGAQTAIVGVREVERVTFSAVAADGSISMDRLDESDQLTVNGKTTNDDTHATTHMVITPNGTLTAYKTSDPDPDHVSARLYVATDPIYAARALGVGDKWSIDYKPNAELGLRAAHGDYTLTAFEKNHGVDTARITFSYHETGTAPDIGASGTLWIELTTGDTVSGDVHLDSVPFGGASSSLASGDVHQERIEGGPLSSGALTPASDLLTKTIDDTVKGFEKLPGLFTLYRKSEFGRDTIYMEIPESQLNHLYMLEATVASGTAEQVIAGEPIDDLVFEFQTVAPDRLAMVTPNTTYRATPGTPMARAIARSFASSYLESFHIEARQKSRKSLLINVSDLFRGDIANVSALFSGPGFALGGGLSFGGTYIMDRENTFIQSLKVFPQNIEAETLYNFIKPGAGIGGSVTLPDPRSAAIRVSYALFQLPETGYTPRLADPRIGYFLTAWQNFSDDARQDPLVHYIYRWKLQKANPKAALSPPVHHIVFWLDNAIPLQYRAAIRHGLLYWNAAFDKIGIEDPIEVRQMPDNADWDPADMRYNVVRWVASPNSAYAVSWMRVNPLTGQILNADITVDSGMAHVTRIEQKRIIDPASWFANPKPASPLAWEQCDMAQGAETSAEFGWLASSLLAPPGLQLDPQKFVDSFLSSTVAHEMGHILGLRHNFIASSWHSLADLQNASLVEKQGITASVMDYLPFNIEAIGHPGVPYWTPVLGTYDKWAIEYGYTPIPGSTPEAKKWRLNAIASECNLPGHAYESDEMADQWDPAVVRFDLGSDPLQYWHAMIQLSRKLMTSLGDRVPKYGQSYSRFTQDFELLLGEYAHAAAVSCLYIGGLYANQNFRGDPGQRPPMLPVPADEQRQALALVSRYVLGPDAWQIPKAYYNNLTGPQYTDLNGLVFGANDFPVRDTLQNVQGAALKHLFSGPVLDRIANNEFKVGDSNGAFKLTELFHAVSASVWSELEAHKDVSALRRQLQRDFLDTMTAMVLGSGAPVPDDARMLAWYQLVNLRTRIVNALPAGHYNTYTQIHLRESLMRINRVLDAQETIGGSGGGGQSLLSMLFGGSKPATPRH